MADHSPTLLIIGFGYSATYIAQALPPHFTVIATSRNAQRRQDFASRYEMIDFPSQDLHTILPRITHILISTPPLPTGDDPMLQHYRDALSQHATALQWIGYLSTTGVYGDHPDGWIDETTQTTPINPRSERRLMAENNWLSFGQSHNIPTHIFRIAGIYGKGRNALEQIRNATAKRIDKPHHYFCRIHVEDIAQIVVATLTSSTLNNSTIFNLCDNHPCPSRDVIEYAASLLDVPAPPLTPFAKAHLSPMAKEFYRCSRRIKNNRIKEVLGITLRYPTYKEGLRSLLT